MVETLHTVREPGDRWRWVYRDDAEAVELRSSATYGSRDEAERAATAVYPGVPLEPAGPADRDEEASDLFDRRSLVVSAATSAAALALLFLVLRAIGRKSGGTPDPRRRRTDRGGRLTRAR